MKKWRPSKTDLYLNVMELIDIVYPLGTGSRWHNNEIRFSLRSIEKNLSNYRKVYIIGECPKFLTNVINIPHKETRKIPDYNIMEKILKACKDPRISDPFLFFNDDHYLITPFDAPTFPHFYYQTLKEKAEARARDSYGLRLTNTLNLLKDQGKPVLHYDTHVPILYHKQPFIDHVASAPWETTKHGFVIKSLYGNNYPNNPIAMPDGKMEGQPSRKVSIYSTKPRVTASTYRYLIESFPKISTFELWDVNQKG